MVAVIRDRGKQYRVSDGQVVDIDYIATAVPGDTLEFPDVLFLGEGEGARVGAPTVEGASVAAEVLGPVKAKKVLVYKFKRRKDYHRLLGHRQQYTRVRIRKISG
jgi:large subunit ribosomal protein L21